MKTNFIILLAVFFIIEIYVYQAIRNITTNNYIRIGYWVFTLLAYGIILYWILTFNRASRDHQQIQLMVSAMMIFVLPKLLSVIFLLIGDFTRFVEFGFKYFTTKENYFPERRKFISTTALAAAGIFSALAIDGIIFGKYRHTVRKVKLRFKNLPESFKGYKIVQISDVHSGSFFNPQKLQKAIDLINEQDADVVLFTGDMVNNYADEFKPFIPLFKSIKAKDGKFSILGNHDYGDYGAWNSREEKAQNIPTLKNYQAEAGFKMLRNENIALEKNGEKIYLLGVENWGIKPFPQYGDLDKALKGVPEDAIKVLMSHDPTHFDEVVKKHKTNVHLTLSGHTHGMQFGLDLKNIKWSPVKFKYKKWADLYKSEGKYLYVNRGFGVIAYPGRVGINPEITVIELV
ncbi:3',5'-cyclic adenosine monophosphate phosphodiesterase CpdA [bioreactor metagenome]|jgi:predicted MPP superfamily phosphohydrolase|uniref:3',5'-cyclic adenosine monophosphate phosphodiesterase CpdA n=1 Tax=bioreactor metagenome TaxID=1076179 RepID=A0A644SNH6_9ZZZZ